MRYAVVILDLDRLPPPASTTTDIKSNAVTFDQDVRHLLRQAGDALIMGRESTSLRLGGDGDRVGVVASGDMSPHALLDRVAEALHPGDSIKRDLLR